MGGTDKLVKVWNVLGDGEGGAKQEVSLVTSRDLGVVSSLTLKEQTNGGVIGIIIDNEDASGEKSEGQRWKGEGCLPSQMYNI